MRQLRRFAGLSRTDQSLLLRAILLVGAIRIGLWLLPFGVMQRIALRRRAKMESAQPISRLVWAVTAVSHYLPGSTCLAQALAAQVLLARSGYQSRVEIGVAKDEPSRFEAHAWLVCEDRVVLGGPGVDRYTSLLALEGKQ